MMYELEVLKNPGPQFWNNLPAVAGEINRRISGNQGRDWLELFGSRHPGRRFERALLLNCSDGWTENRLFELNLVKRVTAVYDRFLPMPSFNGRFPGANASAVTGVPGDNDVIGVQFNGLSQYGELSVWGADLQSAQEKWLARYGDRLPHGALEVANAEPDLPIDRVQADINAAILPEGPFDLVVNYAGAQSIAYQDRVFRAVCKLMTPNGVVVNYDYVGPHRYQYPADQWEKLIEINERLPEKARQVLVYPRLSKMLASDPASAKHSELTLAIMRRYFTIDDFRPVGGAIAHPLLSYNAKLFGFVTNLDEIVYAIMEADWDYLKERPESSLFAYWTARPNIAALNDARALARFSEEEEKRERDALERGGRYYPPTSPETSLYPEDVPVVAVEPEEREVNPLRRTARKLRSMLRDG